MSTRLVGGLIMTHADDNGLVCPPRLAPMQVVIVPIWKTDEEKARCSPSRDKVAAELRADGVRVKLDDRGQRQARRQVLRVGAQGRAAAGSRSVRAT